MLLLARPAAAGRRYNWELAVVDGAAAIALVGGIAMENDPGAALAAAGTFTYLFGAPVAHASHGNGGRATASFGARLVLPLVGALIGTRVNDDSGDPISAGPLYGLAGGMVVAAAFDIAVPAVDTRADDVTVVILPVRDGVTVGVAASF